MFAHARSRDPVTAATVEHWTLEIERPVVAGEPMRWASAAFSGGVGKRLSQLAAARAFALTTGRSLAVWEETLSCKHGFNDFGDGFSFLEFWDGEPIVTLSRSSSGPPAYRSAPEGASAFAPALPADVDDAQGVILEGAWFNAGFARATPYAIDATGGGIPSLALTLPPYVNDGGDYGRPLDAAAALAAAGPMPLRVPRAYDGVAAAAFPSLDWADAAFVHVRRGNYCGQKMGATPATPLPQALSTAYYARALPLLLDGGAAPTLLLFSDDARITPPVFAAALAAAGYALPPNVRVLGTPPRWGGEVVLAAMARCGRGGVLANSMLSWWGAELASRQAAGTEPPRFTVPSPWMSDAGDATAALAWEATTLVAAAERGDAVEAAWKAAIDALAPRAAESRARELAFLVDTLHVAEAALAAATAAGAAAEAVPSSEAGPPLEYPLPPPHVASVPSGGPASDASADDARAASVQHLTERRDAAASALVAAQCPADSAALTPPPLPPSTPTPTLAQDWGCVADPTAALQAIRVFFERAGVPVIVAGSNVPPQALEVAMAAARAQAPRVVAIYFHPHTGPLAVPSGVALFRSALRAEQRNPREAPLVVSWAAPPDGKVFPLLGKERTPQERAEAKDWRPRLTFCGNTDAARGGHISRAPLLKKIESDGSFDIFWRRRDAPWTAASPPIYRVEYEQNMACGEYALCPRGATPIRIYEALARGRIPVIAAAYDAELPLPAGLVPWRECAVLATADHYVPQAIKEHWCGRNDEGVKAAQVRARQVYDLYFSAGAPLLLGAMWAQAEEAWRY